MLSKGLMVCCIKEVFDWMQKADLRIRTSALDGLKCH